MSNLPLSSIESLRTKNLYFCIPSQSGQISSETFKSFIEWGNIATMLGITWTVETITSKSTLCNIRNQFVDRFIKNEVLTHIILIDPDVAFTPHSILQLLSTGKHIITAMVPQPELPINFGLTRDEDMIQEAEIKEIKNISSGLIVFSREVFTHLDDHPSVALVTDSVTNELFKTYFNPSILSGQSISDLETFCNNWRSLGGKVWAHSEVIAARIGWHTFTES